MARGKTKAQLAAEAEAEVKVDSVSDGVTIDSAPVVEQAADEPKVAEKSEEQGGEVVRETIHQLGIFTDYIYNVRDKAAVVMVDNMGYGDIYVSVDGAAEVGKSERVSFKESKKFEGVDKLYFKSASQPVVQILEVK